MTETPSTDDTGITLDLTGLLGAGQVFDPAADAETQAELIDAHCNKIGSEGCFA